MKISNKAWGQQTKDEKVQRTKKKKKKWKAMSRQKIWMKMPKKYKFANAISKPQIKTYKRAQHEHLFPFKKSPRDN